MDAGLFLIHPYLLGLRRVIKGTHANTDRTRDSNGYNLMLAALILVGGSLGDIYGRGRIFSC